MWTKSFNVEVILIFSLSLIPWPGPSVFKISCSRESARVVRKIVQNKWQPILDKYQVKIPMECPFHPVRDIFGPQQAAKKQNRPSQWTCGFCGKSFYEEKHLDTHFETRHKSNINMAEDAICLADYCDIMRCDVLVAQDSSLTAGPNGDPSFVSTDIEIWSESTAYRTALTPSGPRDIAKLPTTRKTFMPSSLIRLQALKPDDDERAAASSSAVKCDKMDHMQESVPTDVNFENLMGTNDETGHDDSDDIYDDDGDEDDDDSDDANTTASCDGNLVDAALPPVDQKQQKINEFQRMKANCKSEELDVLKLRCETLVRNCIAGLLVYLSEDDFKGMEEELNRAVCWYLTCERYWEDGPSEPRPFPWGLVFVLIIVLSLGMCFCYYIIWILFDTDDHTIPNTMTHSSPSHNRLHHMGSSTSGGTTSSYQQHLQHQHLQQQHLNAMQQQNMSHQNLTTTHLGAATGITPGQSVVPPPISSSAPSNAQALQQLQQTGQIGLDGQPSAAGAAGYSEEFFSPVTDFNDVMGAAAGGQSEHYIYVTYPPELKRRLLESCYNRTTRL